MCVCVRVCVCVRACVRVCACVRVKETGSEGESKRDDRQRDTDRRDCVHACVYSERRCAWLCRAYHATRNPCVACECTAESESVSVCGCTGGGEGEGETEPGVDLSVRLSLNHAEHHPAVPPLPTVLRR